MIQASAVGYTAHRSPERGECAPYKATRKLAALRAAVALAAALAGCARPQPPSATVEPPEVEVALPLDRKIRDYEDFLGRTAAVNTVEVRPRVSGYLVEIPFKEGAEVVAGDVLFRIDPRPYEAQLARDQAQRQQAEANLNQARADYARAQELAKTPGAISAQDVDRFLAQQGVAEAQVRAADAAIRASKLNVEFCTVRSPIDGRVSRYFVTLGNLVIQDQTTLTSIVSQDPIYVYFDVDEHTALRVQQLIREGKFHSSREPGVKTPVYLRLATGRDYGHEGFIDFINNQLDPATGTLQLRAVFPNPKPPVGDRVLTPGLFVRVRGPVSAEYRALLVVQPAVLTDQNVKYVFVVGPDNKVSRRNVTLGTQHDSLVVITDGLKPGDRVVINGLQQVRPGATVRPKVVPMPQPTPEGSAAAPGGSGAGAGSGTGAGR